MRYFFILLASCCIVTSTYAQNINDLKKKQQQAKAKIELTNRLLNETRKSQKTTVSNLDVIKKQISERENLISALNSEITLMDANLQSLDSEKQMLERRLTTLRKEYADLVYHAYFFKSNYNEYLFIFSSKTFGQAFRRLRYVQQYSKYRKDQTLQIQEVAAQLGVKLQQMVETKNQKAVVLQGKQVETQHLQTAQETKQKMLADLSKKEQKLRDQLKQQQKQVGELNNKIDQLIAKEIANAERKAEEKRRKEEAAEAAKAAKAQKAEKAEQAQRTEKVEKNNNKETPTNKPSKQHPTTVSKQTPTTSPTSKPTAASLMTKEEGVLAGGFEKNIGRLPWPVRGVITGHFGIHPHPVLTHVEVNNKGIYIDTERNTDACAVFAGEVTQVFAIPGSNNAIIVKHGNYRTVYANLTSTYVKVGDKVNAKQRLGKVYVDMENDNKTELYFMLYKNSNLENPERWLSK